MIKKAVLPVAGLGTRFLPASKAIPKEMLPIIDKPLVQYAVEEAVREGINEIIFVTSPEKFSIKNHFKKNKKIESILIKSGKQEIAEKINNKISEFIEKLSNETNLSLIDLALSWVLSRNFLSSILIGVRDISHIMKPINILENPINGTILNEINEIIPVKSTPVAM